MPQLLKVAHRGLHDQHVENTLEALQAAYAAGCDMVEFDVQLSRDHVPVIFHDDDLRRLAGCAEKVYELDFEPLRKIELFSNRKVGVGISGKYASTAGVKYYIPSLEEFLRSVPGKPYYLELKIPTDKIGDAEYAQTLARNVIRTMGASELHPSTFLASFQEDILEFIYKERLFPKLAFIFESYRDFDRYCARPDPARTPFQFCSLPWRAFKSLLKSERNGGHVVPHDRILIWNIKGKTDFDTALHQKVAGLVTDDVRGLLSFDAGS